jgi:hypothetical protein
MGNTRWVVHAVRLNQDRFKGCFYVIYKRWRITIFWCFVLIFLFLSIAPFNDSFVDSEIHTRSGLDFLTVGLAWSYHNSLEMEARENSLCHPLYFLAEYMVGKSHIRVWLPMKLIVQRKYTEKQPITQYCIKNYRLCEHRKYLLGASYCCKIMLIKITSKLPCCSK